jgi:hypothetical protein
MKYSNPLISTLLIGAGLLNLVAPVLAAEIATLKNTAIDNTANATYEDPTGLTINATSNTVKVVVAEVAGLDVSAAGINDLTPADSIKIGDTLEYIFTVTNIGNAETSVHIPSNPAITGPGTLTKVQYLDPVTKLWTDVPAGGVTIPGVKVNQTIPVKVVLVANDTNTNNNVIEVKLGDTPKDEPNQPLSADGNNGDINTVGGAPANGQRESSATQKTSIGSVVKNIALATVTEKLIGTSNGGTPSVLTDDVLTYQLGLKVADLPPLGSTVTPASLAGTKINLDGDTAAIRILVSSAIPAGTVLAEKATAPTGWKAVYSETPVTATSVANAAVWSTTFDPAKTYYSVGFVNDPTVTKVVAPGDEVGGLTFKVKTSGATGNSYTVNSIAQLFGATDSTDAAVKDIVVYDESGDNIPNNYTTPASLDPTVSTLPAAVADGTANGVAKPLTDGKDSGNDNTGTTASGDINQYIYNYVTTTLLNGPKDAPGATGPDATTGSDFTDKSSAVPAGKGPSDAFDPAPVGFFNTIQNTGTVPADIALLPQFTNDKDLPVGTTIRIYTGGAVNQSATYEVTATGIKFVSGTAAGGATAPTATSPVTLLAVAPGATGQYQVEVDLPLKATPTGATTPDPTATTPAQDFPVVINAFTGGVIDATKTELAFVAGKEPASSNLTTDKVYTGFIKMTKETQILQGTGPAVTAADATFSDKPKSPVPGNIIEYRITYENVSDKAVGSGNVVLNASKLVITEDGTTLLNKWAQDQDSNGKIDTSNVVGSAKGETGSTVDLFSGVAGTVGSSDKTGTTADADVTKYINTLTTVVAPGQKGTFTFQRKLN